MQPVHQPFHPGMEMMVCVSIIILINFFIGSSYPQMGSPLPVVYIPVYPYGHPAFQHGMEMVVVPCQSLTWQISLQGHPLREVCQFQYILLVLGHMFHTKVTTGLRVCNMVYWIDNFSLQHMPCLDLLRQAPHNPYKASMKMMVCELLAW